MQEEGIRLLDLLSALRDGVENLFPDRLWVRAEIASVQTRSNGHCYLELSQSDAHGVVARARAVIWRSRYMPLATYFREATGGELQPGIEILVRASVNYSEIYGLTLDIDEIEPAFTLGEAEIRRRRTIAELEESGLMDRQKGLELTYLPYRLAVISAPDAAGFGDFRKHLSENEYGFAFELSLFEASMQGEGAPSSVADALERIETSGVKYDAVLLLRGGGSALDLACFDDFDMCFAIANCPVPVFTAIGHERDTHVADLVAFRSVKTPTALADEFVDAVAAEDERLSAFASRLALAFSARIASMEARVDMLEERIRRGDPRNVLERGYTLVAGPDSRVVKSVSSLAEGDVVRILFSDGSLTARIEKIDK